MIGVAKDARYFDFGLRRPSVRSSCFPRPSTTSRQRPPATDPNPSSHVLRDIIIVTRPGAQVSAAVLQQAITSVDAALPLISIRTLTEQVARGFGQQRLIARLTSFFSVLSLALASIGLYGVTAYNAGRRTSEIGVRVALGATRGDVVRLIVRSALGLVAIGLLVGIAVDVCRGPFLGTRLYGSSPDNPAAIVTAVLALGRVGPRRRVHSGASREHGVATHGVAQRMSSGPQLRAVIRKPTGVFVMAKRDVQQGTLYPVLRVRYRPRKPDDAYIATFAQMWIMPILWLVAGVLAIVLS